MKNEEYVVDTEKEKVKATFLLVLIFLGWFGIDKIVYAKSFAVSWKFFLVKFAYSLIGVGLLWNIFDIVQYCRHRYQFDFRNYFL